MRQSRGPVDHPRQRLERSLFNIPYTCGRQNNAHRRLVSSHSVRESDEGWADGHATNGGRRRRQSAAALSRYWFPTRGRGQPDSATGPAGYRLARAMWREMGGRSRQSSMMCGRQAINRTGAAAARRGGPSYVATTDWADCRISWLDGLSTHARVCVCVCDRATHGKCRRLENRLSDGSVVRVTACSDLPSFVAHKSRRRFLVSATSASANSR